MWEDCISLYNLLNSVVEICQLNRTNESKIRYAWTTNKEESASQIWECNCVFIIYCLTLLTQLLHQVATGFYLYHKSYSAVYWNLNLFYCAFMFVLVEQGHCHCDFLFSAAHLKHLNFQNFGDLSSCKMGTNGKVRQLLQKLYKKCCFCNNPNFLLKCLPGNLSSICYVYAESNTITCQVNREA